MALGTKRICQSCAAKFYDLDKDPIKCPKCAAVFDASVSAKPKRGRKKAAAEPAAEEIEIAIDDDAIEELDDEAAAEELDEETRVEMEVGDDEVGGHGKGEDKVLVDLDEENSDIIESDNGPEKE